MAKTAKTWSVAQRRKFKKTIAAKHAGILDSKVDKSAPPPSMDIPLDMIPMKDERTGKMPRKVKTAPSKSYGPMTREERLAMCRDMVKVMIKVMEA